MLGSIIGDIIGSTYEFHNTLDYNFELFPQGSTFTDDTVCTIAVADAILRGIPYRDSLHDWCNRYPHRGYGGMFRQWIHSDNPQPYGSFGNGAAMRVSPVGWAYSNPGQAMKEAAKTAECTHNHLEGIKGAETIAACVTYLATHHDAEYARRMVNDLCAANYGPDYKDHLPEPGEFDVTCQGCVPLAVTLFLESTNFEDAIRLAVSYGGDSDTLCCIVGSLAGAAYDIPTTLREKALSYLSEEMKTVVTEFEQKYCNF